MKYLRNEFADQSVLRREGLDVRLQHLTLVFVVGIDDIRVGIELEESFRNEHFYDIPLVALPLAVGTLALAEMRSMDFAISFLSLRLMTFNRLRIRCRYARVRCRSPHRQGRTACRRSYACRSNTNTTTYSSSSSVGARSTQSNLEKVFIVPGCPRAP